MKKINKKTQPGLVALKKKAPQVVAQMGYMKKGMTFKKSHNKAMRKVGR